MKINYNDLIPVTDTKAWLESLCLCGDYDIYHTHQYHLLSEMMGEGKPYLFYYSSKFGNAALPFLLRPLTEINGIKDNLKNDITSVYGYPGIITSVREGDKNVNIFKTDFQEALTRLLRKLSVVTFFSRTNPLLPNTWLLKGMAQRILLSSTVAINLSQPDEKQIRSMTKGHRYDIRKARRIGITVEEDSSFHHIDDFIRIYNETMKRKNAKENYYFPKKYYLQLKECFGESIKLYFAIFKGELVSASIFFMTGRIIQYHLSGTLSEFLPMNGAKLILDEVRRIGTQKGFLWLHLGGGVGSLEDSLYRFKAGFSKIRLPFEVVKLIIDSEIYSKLNNMREKWAQFNGYTLSKTDFFPYYRKPLHPKEIYSSHE